jgi:hypothetical protein
LISEEDLDSAEQVARERGGLDAESVLYLTEELRRLRRREELRAVLMEHSEKIERFLERDEGATGLSVSNDGALVEFRKLRHYAGDGLWRYAIHDPARLQKDKPLDPPLMLSRLTFR